MALLKDGSSAQRRLAEFILRNPIRAAASSIDDMARATGISAPTISRFARELGHSGFAEMRTNLADALQGVMEPVAKLREQLDTRVPANGASAMIDALRSQMALMDVAGIERQATQIVARLNRAASVYVMGFGLSAHLAAILSLGLQPFHASVTTVMDYGGTEVAAGRLMAITTSDVLIAITLPRYTTDAVSLTRYARDKGAATIVITDSPASPLAALADELLLAPAEHPVLSSSMVTALAAIEMIIATMMLSNAHNADKAAGLTEAIASYLHQEVR
jgi:DNA-binding MurR/RpiR family transcriptional regulator